MFKCRRCGSYLIDGICQPCREKDIMASCPSVVVSNDRNILEVRLTPLPGKPFPQPMSLSDAEARGFVAVFKTGHDLTVAFLSSRAKLHVKEKL